MSQRKTIDLSGTWRAAAYTPQPGQEPALPQMEGLSWLPATVPGSILYDLMQAGQLDNPFASKQAAEAAAWVSNSDWLCAREFDLAEEFLGRPRLYLQLNSVDTYADIWLNGVRLGETANMFRVYRFDISGVPLKRQGNQLLIHLKSPFRMVAGKAAASPLPEIHRHKGLIRRYPRSFFCHGTNLLNLGTAVVGIGITRSVEIHTCPEASIEDYCVSTQRATAERAELTASVCLHKQAQGEELQVEFALWGDGPDSPISVATVQTRASEVSVPMAVDQPKLWWPRGYGEPSLYHLTVTVSRGGVQLDTLTRRIGLRTVRVARQLANGKKAFYLEVNGREVYVRGTNLMPVDYLQPASTPEQEEWLLRLALEQHVNMVRLWGGGIPAADRFLDRCDELGIMVWQDFFFHSAPYPDDDPEFMAEVEREAIDLVHRVRNHACLALICGGNEQEQGWEEWNWQAQIDRFYGEKLFKELLPAVCRQHCPSIPYVRNSPHGGASSQSAVEGDVHSWGNYFHATKNPQLVSETTWSNGAYSRPETLRERMGLDVSEFVERGWHRRWQAITDQPLFSEAVYSGYRTLESLPAYLQALEIEQREADAQALSLLRLRSPSCRGILYWCLNKGSPMFMPGCVDYHGRPLMAYYEVKRLFSDLLVGAYRDIDDVRIVGSNLTAAPVQGELRILHYRADATLLNRWQLPVTVQPGITQRLFDIERLNAQVVDRTQEMLFVALEVGGQLVAYDALFFCLLAEYAPLSAPFESRAEPCGAGRWRLTLEGQGVAPLIEIHSSERLVLSDNAFTLVPGVPRTIEVTAPGDQPLSGVHLTISAWNSPYRQQVALLPADRS